VRLEVAQWIEAPRRVVWDVLTSWERQHEWMSDALAVEVLTPQRAGVGVTIRCPTKLLGVTVQDVMRVTGWIDGRELEIVHLGTVIRGTGTFRLEDRDGGTYVRWIEQIDPPFGAIGEWAASTLALPLLRRVFAGSLAGLDRVVAGGLTTGCGEWR